MELGKGYSKEIESLGVETLCSARYNSFSGNPNFILQKNKIYLFTRTPKNSEFM